MNKTFSAPADFSRVADYPILRNLPASEARDIIEQSKAGIPLTSEQLVRLGLNPLFKNFILLPKCGGTPAQLRAAFPGMKAATR